MYNWINNDINKERVDLVDVYKCRRCEQKIEVRSAVWVSCCGRMAIFLGNEHCYKQSSKPETKEQLTLFEVTA